MGWSSGSKLFSKIVEQLEEGIPDIDTRMEAYKILIPLFEDDDIDLEDCVGIDVAFDSVWEEMYPEPEEGEDDY